MDRRLRLSVLLIVLAAVSAQATRVVAQTPGPAADEELPVTYGTAGQLFQRRSYEQALQICRQLLQQPLSERQQQQVRALSAECCLRLGHREQAVQQLEQMYQENSLAADLSLLPLVWDHRLPDRERYVPDPRDLHSASPVRKLAAAAALLHVQQHQAVCAQLLVELREQLPPPLGNLAEFQSWRIDLLQPDGDHTAVWEQRAQRLSGLPQHLRNGAHFVVARGLQHHGNAEAASELFLWVPLMPHHDRFLAASSLYEAIHCFRLSGRNTAANRLQQELLDRFADTQVAARCRLAQQQGSADPASGRKGSAVVPSTD